MKFISTIKEIVNIINHASFHLPITLKQNKLQKIEQAEISKLINLFEFATAPNNFFEFEENNVGIELFETFENFEDCLNDKQIERTVSINRLIYKFITNNILKEKMLDFSCRHLNKANVDYFLNEAIDLNSQKNIEICSQFISLSQKINEVKDRIALESKNPIGLMKLYEYCTVPDNLWIIKDEVLGNELLAAIEKLDGQRNKKEIENIIAINVIVCEFIDHALIKNRILDFSCCHINPFNMNMLLHLSNRLNSFKHVEICSKFIEKNLNSLNSSSTNLIEEMNQKIANPPRYKYINMKMSILKIHYKTEPEILKSALKAKDFYGNTPLHYAAWLDNDIEKLQFFTEIVPEALSILNKKGSSVFSILKGRRTANFKLMYDKYKHNEITKSAIALDKEILKRKQLAQSMSISNETDLIDFSTKKKILNIDLNGGFPEQWLNSINKDLTKFLKENPDVLNQDQISFLQEILSVASDQYDYSTEELLQRIKDGFPTMINTGYNKHAVNFFFWGDQFIICNCGGASRRPLEIYHFKLEKLDVNIIDSIKKLSFENEDYYIHQLENWPRYLGLSQTLLDQSLEKDGPLSMQTSGNCSLASPLANIYALLLIAKVRSTPEGFLTEKKLIDIKEQNIELLKNEASELYHKLKRFFVESKLKRVIAQFKTNQMDFEPDHQLIRTAFAKARTFGINKEKIGELFKIYNNFCQSNQIK